MSIHNNRIVVDLNKVQYAYFHYTNQYGNISHTDVDWSTVRGEGVTQELALYHPDYPNESLYDRAKRLNLLDVWTPTLHLKLQAYCHLIYTGDKAVSLWKAWQAKQFGKKKGKG